MKRIATAFIVTLVLSSIGCGWSGSDAVSWRHGYDEGYRAGKRSVEMSHLNDFGFSSGASVAASSTPRIRPALDNEEILKSLQHSAKVSAENLMRIRMRFSSGHKDKTRKANLQPIEDENSPNRNNPRYWWLH